ncbi:MAG: ABC transporter permease, partial [Acidobacteria bacterium]|nr:ABC transporter permease [Acidobacteriota bacterium]
ADTALFSVVNGVLLNPLPFPKPEQLVAVYFKTSTFAYSSIAYPNFQDWQKNNQCFSALGGIRGDDYNLTGAGEPERLHAHMISAEFFPVLGLQPILGRTFSTEEDQPGAAPVVILGDGLWKRKFGSAPDVLNKSIALNGKPHTIIGVATGRLPGFTVTEVYTPLGQWSDPTFRDRRISMGLNAVARMKRGVTVEQARTEMDRVGENLAATFPDANKGTGVTLVPLKKDTVGDVQGILFVLLGAVSFVLLIACANVANLLLARSTGRRREFAVRAALGASRSRVIRQLITESLLLGLVGGGLGLVLATWGMSAMVAALPANLPRTDEIAMDWHVLAFAVGVSLLTSVVFGLVPAIKAAKPDLQETLKEGGRGASGKRHRVQTVLVAAEMALAMVLLIGAGLMIRSLAALWEINPGFDPRNALSFGMSLTSAPNTTPDQLRGKYREMVRQIQGVPGMVDVSVVGGSLPMTGDSEVPFWLEGQAKPANQNEMPLALFYLVTSGYHNTMRISLERGRLLSENDNERAAQVMLIDSTFARKYFPNQDPVGKHLNIGLLDMRPEIVGVVAHVEHWGLGSRQNQNLQAQIYLPFFQVPDKFAPLLASGAGFVVRTAAAPSSAVSGIRGAVQKTDSTAVIYEPRPMEEIVANSISRQRLVMVLLSSFSALALTLASVGIYGVISYLAGQRTHEIGIRMALGATRKDVLGLVLGEGMKITLVGVGVGIAAALGLTRLLSEIIYGVGATDSLTFGSVTVLLTGVALLACYVPARRATKINPIVALRYE